MRATVLVVLLAVPAAAAADGAAGLRLAWHGDAWWAAWEADAPFDVAWETAAGRGSAPAEPQGNRTWAARLPPDLVAYTLAGGRVAVDPVPAPPDAVRVAFVADVGPSSSGRAILRAIAAEDPDLVIVGGDLAYAHGDARVWDAWLDEASAFARDRPFMVVPGNHEHRCAREDHSLYPCDVERVAYVERFVMPGNERYYTIDWGPVRFVGLDTEAYSEPVFWDETDPDAQGHFAREALAARPDAWVVPFFHRAPWTSGEHHGSDTAVRDALAPLFDATDVPLVLAGHEHLYERTHPLRGGARADDGVVYVTAGGGGAELYAFADARPEWSAFRAAEHSFVILDATPTRLAVRALRADGSVLDAFTLERPTAVEDPPEDGPDGPSDDVALPGPASARTPAPGALAVLAAWLVAARRR